MGCGRIPALAMFDDFRCPLKTAHLANARNVFAVPFQPKFEILIGIQTLRIDWKLSHCGFSLSLNLAGHLLDLDHDKFGGIKRGKAYKYIDDSLIDTGLGIVFAIALDEVGLLRRRPLERPLQKQALHEGTYIQADLAP